MSTQGGRRRRGAYNPGVRSAPKNRSSGPSYDKSFLTKGIYANPRITHAATALIGCEVKVQVKNGAVYAGVFKTFSEGMDIVLELAHKLDDGIDSNPNDIPSKDRLVDKIIFNFRDIVEITAQNVDLEYATRGKSPESFTDSAISKYNGQASDREMKELTPWEGEAEHTMVDLEETSSSSNGWDASEMFKTNEKKFDIKSSYDPSLEQYTTPLTKQNTKEYKEREAEAAKIANEIEGSDTYRQRIALENGDGDEEKKFSAVLGPNEQSSGGKYVPPHMRRGNPSQGRPGRSSTNPHPAKQQATQSEPVETKVNGDDRKVAEVVVAKSPTTNEAPAQVSRTAETRTPKDRSPAESDKRLNPKVIKDPKLEELRKFGADFKLSEQDSKERKQRENRQTQIQTQQQQQQQHPRSEAQQPADTHWQPQTTTGVAAQPAPATETPQEPASPAAAAAAVPNQEQAALAEPSTPTATEREEESRDLPQEDGRINETLKKSTLNPNAKEFVLNPNAKTFTPRLPVQTPTPPRPQTQSPGMSNTYPQAAPVQAIPQFSPYTQQASYVMPVSMPPHQPRFQPPKRAVVSVTNRHDFSPAAQAAAATGQPLLAGPAAFHNQPQYTIHMQQQMMHATTSAQMPQMVQVGVGQRMVGPVIPVSQEQHSLMPQQMHQPQTVIVSPPGATAIPAHLPQPGPHPAHMAPHHQPTPPHSQATSHMGGAGAGGHPAPSPVHQHPGGAQHGMQGHPPTSGTPTPHIVYHNPQLQQQGAPHPPLQASPHTPTSPQANYPPFVAYSQHMAMQGAPGVIQAQAAHQHPAGAAMPGQVQQHPQYVMMPPAQPAQHHGQAQQGAGTHPQMQPAQFQPPLQAQPMRPTQVMYSEAQVPGAQMPHSVSSATNVHPVHYVAQMPSQGHHTQVQAYHPQ